jgi:hypothetical protein
MEQGLGTWLVVGHGSVGAALARRLASARATVLVYDPSPRIPVTTGDLISQRDLEGAHLAGAMSSVPPSQAAAAMRVISLSETADGMLFDWNTLPPDSKLQLERESARRIVDVALLDSLDRDGTDTFVAISGTETRQACQLLRSIGFDVTVVGDACGEAAYVKMTRSLFMKSLEALVLEYRAVTASSSSSDILRRSLERSLGKECVDFFDLLLKTSRLHAERRAGELVEAVGVFDDKFPGLVMAPAATTLLQKVAAAWGEDDSPQINAPIAELMVFLRGRLHGQ